MRASIPTSRRVAVALVDPAHRRQLLADQRAGGGLLVGGVDLRRRPRGPPRRRRPCGAARRPAPAGPAPGRPAATPPTAGRTPRRRSGPTSVNRSSSRVATSSGTLRGRSLSASSRRRAGPAGQLVEQDRARHRLGVGVRTQGLGRRGGSRRRRKVLGGRIPPDRPPSPAS